MNTPPNETRTGAERGRTLAADVWKRGFLPHHTVHSNSVHHVHFVKRVEFYRHSIETHTYAISPIYTRINKYTTGKHTLLYSSGKVTGDWSEPNTRLYLSAQFHHYRVTRWQKTKKIKKNNPTRNKDLMEVRKIARFLSTQKFVNKYNMFFTASAIASYKLNA